jgi:thiol-disulfide isomerase/thioredoxin
MKKILFAFVLFFSFVSITYAYDVTVYLFHSESCPHCKEEREFLSTIQDDYPNLSVVMYEVTTNEENREFLKTMKKKLGVSNSYVPFTVIGSYTVTGFSSTAKNHIMQYIDYCTTNGCNDVVKGEEVEFFKESSTVSIPLLGTLDVKDVSLPLVSIILGFVDGFNPCAMWVLIFLISMLLTMKDRKRMWLIGFSFLLTSALIYTLFMVAWLKVTIELSSILFVRVFIALVALIGGIFNLRSYFKMRKQSVGCVVTNDTKRKKIIHKIKEFTKEKSLFLAILGAISLAISVNIVELACSAGLPLIFTSILSYNDLNVMEYSFYIFIYILFYMIDDIVVFILAMVSLKVTGITNKYNKYSKLIGGVIMLLIGILMIFAPSILMFSF